MSKVAPKIHSTISSARKVHERSESMASSVSEAHHKTLLKDLWQSTESGQKKIRPVTIIAKSL
jgi:hypothetical protein